MKRKWIAGGIALVLVLAAAAVFFLPGEGSLKRRFVLGQKQLHAPTESLEKVSYDGETLVMADETATYFIRRLALGRMEVTVQEETASNVMVYNLLGKLVSIDGIPISEFVKVTKVN